MFRGITIILAFILLILGPWYFFKNPLDAVYCLMSGGEWASQGTNERFCLTFFTDAGKDCSTGDQCRSGKCVIGINGEVVTLQGDERIKLGVFNNILDPNISGRCSKNNQNPCYSGEIVINSERIVTYPSSCN